MTLTALGQIALPVSDTDRSARFYGEALGLPPLFRFGTLAFFDCAGVRLMLEGRGEAVVPGSGVCHCFKVADLDEAHARLAEGGVVFKGPPHLVARMPDHELWMAFFTDPDGHLLALMAERHG